MRQPEGDTANIPEIKFSGGIQNGGLQADCAGGQDGVEPDADLPWQGHVNDNGQNAKQQSRREAGRHGSDPRREKCGEADGGQQAEQTGRGDKKLQLSDIHSRQIDNGEQHLHGGFGAFPAPETV